MTRKLVTIVGARPQFIKAAAISRVLRSTDVNDCIVHTGQHYDDSMSSVFFEELEIPAPAYNLSVGSASHGAQTGRMLEKIEEVLIAESPETVVVYGDTNSTLAGALAAAKLHIPVAHVEAGLRSHNRRMPEEVNRILTDHCSDILFAPTQAAVNLLRNEGVSDEKIHLVGDVMYDVAIYSSHRAEYDDRRLADWGIEPQNYILSTVHRAENTDDRGRLAAIVDGLIDVSKQVSVVLPCHPRTASALQRIGMWERAQSELTLIDPVGYLDMALLECNARVVATDSGGVQKEAFFHQVPCVTLRDETEWTELVDLGWNRLVPPVSSASITRNILESIGQVGQRGQPYGDGNSARRIAELLLNESIDPVCA